VGCWGGSSEAEPGATARCLQLSTCAASSTCAVDICPSRLGGTADGLSLCPGWAGGHQKFMVKALRPLQSKLLSRKYMKPRMFLLLQAKSIKFCLLMQTLPTFSNRSDVML